MKRVTLKDRGPAFQKLLYTILAFVGIFAAEVVGALLAMLLGALHIIEADSLWESILPECFGAAAAVLAVGLLGGKDFLKPTKDDISYTFRFGWWCMAISVGAGVLDLMNYLYNGVPVEPGWFVRMLELALFCLFIGILEELMFRGLIFNALLALVGDTHKGVVWSVMITSVAFGVAHVDFTTDFTDGLSVVQAILKVVQTGVYSVMLCVIVLHTRKLAGVSLFHAVDDFVIMAPGIALYHESADIDYVSTGDDAVPTILYYLLIIGLYLPFLIKSLVVLHKEQVVWHGAFMDHDGGAVGAGAGAPALPQAVGGVPVTPQVPGAAPVSPQVSGAVPPVEVPSPAEPSLREPGPTFVQRAGDGRGAPPAPKGYER